MLSALTLLAAACRGAAASAPTIPPRVHIGLTAAVAPWRLPAPLVGAAAVPVSDGALILGGSDSGGTSTPTILAIGRDGAVRNVGTLPAAEHDAGAAIVDGVVLIYGGASVSPLDLVQRWTTGPGLVIGHLSEARAGDAVTVLDGRVYVAGGYDGIRLVRSIMAVSPESPGSRLSEVGLLAQGVEGGAMAGWRKSLWMVGGIESLVGGILPVESKLIQRFYVKTGVTTVVGHLPQPVSGATAFVLDDQLFVVGGERAGVPVDDIWRIDSHGRPALVGHLPEPRSHAAGVVVDDHTAWLVGGRVPNGPSNSAVILRAQIQ